MWLNYSAYFCQDGERLSWSGPAPCEGGKEGGENPRYLVKESGFFFGDFFCTVGVPGVDGRVGFSAMDMFLLFFNVFLCFDFLRVSASLAAPWAIPVTHPRGISCARCLH